MTTLRQSTPTLQRSRSVNSDLEHAHPLDTTFLDGHESLPIQPHAPPVRAFTHWLSVEQIRKMQRMRRQTVIAAMDSGELPFERRGRIRYARLSDVQLWEEKRITQPCVPSTRGVDPELADLVG